MRKITEHLRYDDHKSQIMATQFYESKRVSVSSDVITTVLISQYAGHFTKIKFIHFEKATESEEIPRSQYGQS